MPDLGGRSSHPARVEHLVVLMLENHSFDHLLGFLDHPRPERFDGLSDGYHYNVDHNGSRVYATKVGKPHGFDPDHSHEGALLQIGAYGDVTTNGGFVRSYEDRHPDDLGKGALVMQCLDPGEHCRVLAELAKEFAVCTAWFCSVPGETWPNRNFAHAATSDGTVNIELGFYYDRTIFEQLEAARASWRIYYDGTPQVWCFRRLWKPRLIMDFLLRRRPPRIANFAEFDDFVLDVSHGKLANYTFIEPAHNRFNSDTGAPRRTNSQHPHNNPKDSPGDFMAGEMLIQEVYEALRKNQPLFERTLLLITYDEHGGLYDHVPPPCAVAPDDIISRGTTRRLGRFGRSLVERLKGVRRPKADFDFRQLGVRVPAVLVSPWIEPGTVVTDRFDHASIPATLRTLFAPRLSSLTARDEAANTFHSIVTESPRSDPRSCPALSISYPVARGPSPDVPPSELDRALAELDRSVKAELRASPAAKRLRKMAPRPRGEPVNLFAATARGARAWAGR